jgi:hypothetical protein
MLCSEGLTLFPSETPPAGDVPLGGHCFFLQRLSSSRLLLWKAVGPEGSIHINKAHSRSSISGIILLVDTQDTNTHPLEPSSPPTPALRSCTKPRRSDTMTNSIQCLVCGVKECYRLCFYEHFRTFQCHNIDCGLYRARTCIIEGLLCPISFSQQTRAPSPPPARARGFRSAFGNEPREDDDRRERGQSRYAPRNPPRESFSYIGVDKDCLRDRFRDRGNTRPNIHFRHIHISTDPEPSHGRPTRYGDPEMENLSRRFERTSVRDPYDYPTREGRPSEREYRETAYEDGYRGHSPSPPRGRRAYRDERPPPAEDRAPQYSGYWCTEDPDGNVIDVGPCYCPPPPPASHVS